MLRIVARTMVDRLTRGASSRAPRRALYPFLALSVLAACVFAAAALADGTLDPSFASGGIATGASAAAYGLLARADGTLVTAGLTEGEAAIERFGANGASSGVTQLAAGSYSALHSIAQQSNGSLVATGVAEEGGHRVPLIARFKSDGSVDNGYGSGGATLIPNTDLGGGVSAGGFNLVAIDPTSDKAIAIGDYFNESVGGHEGLVARFTTGGALDTSFNSGGATPGLESLALGANNFFTAGLVQPGDGKIVVGGQGNKGVVARLEANGGLDGSFNGTGSVAVPDLWNVCAIGEQEDGKLVIAGPASSDSTDSTLEVERLNSDGSLDTSFGADSGGGHTSVFVGELDGGYSSEVQCALAFEPDGSIVVSSTSATLRLTASGALDPTWGSGGVGTVPMDYAYALAVQPTTGKPIVGGVKPSGGGTAAVLARLSTATATPEEPTPTGGGGGGGSGGGGPGEGAASGSAKAPKLKGTALAVTLVCDASDGIPCEVLGQLTSTEHLHGKKVVAVSSRARKPKKRGLTVGQQSFSIPAGEQKTVMLPLNRKGLRLLKEFGKLPARLTVTLANAAPPQVLLSRTVKFKQKKHKGHPKHRAAHHAAA